MKNKKILIWGGIAVVVLIFLFAWPKINDPYSETVALWKENDIDCLPSHTKANLHIHPHLSVIVDGAPEIIPANVGVVSSCMAEVHTHDADNVLHVESVRAGKEFQLKQFFVVYGKSLLREGFDLAMTVDGTPSSELGNIILKDKQEVVLTYTKKTNAEQNP